MKKMLSRTFLLIAMIPMLFFLFSCDNGKKDAALEENFEFTWIEASEDLKEGYEITK